MKVLFLGYAVDFETAKQLSGVSIAGNKMQVQVLSELEKYDDVELSSITVYPVAAFPRDKKVYYKKKNIKVTEKINSIRIPFLNLPIIKQFFQTLAVYNTAKKIVDKDTKVITFNLFPQVGLPLMWLKKKFNCTTYSLLADLPIDDYSSNKNTIRNFFRKIFDNLTKKAIKNCDKLIVLNSNAVKFYAPDKEFIVMEGGIDIGSVPTTYIPYNQRPKRIVYSGALTEYSGVINLIEAMKFVTQGDVTLEIYGGGYLADEITQIAKTAKNVKYCGKVDYQTMLSIQQNSYLLVNPRPVDDPISLVTFPSKMFEYMVSGTAVLSTKLNGLTDDYLKNIFYIENNTPRLLADAINDILSKPLDSIEKMVLNSQDFILKNKTWELQVEKIHLFLGEDYAN